MGKNEEKKDTVEKEFVSFPDIAADVINVLLYEGKRVTEPKKLLAGPRKLPIRDGKNSVASMRICVNLNWQMGISMLCI